MEQNFNTKPKNTDYIAFIAPLSVNHITYFYNLIILLERNKMTFVIV